MDLPWGDERTIQFVTNVGLITSNGSYGDNIMAAEWTHHISYSPGLIAVCIRSNDATYDNIQQTKEFGVNICASDQATVSNISGIYTRKEVDKINALKELEFKFYKANKIKTLMLEGAVVNIECKLVKEIPFGSHTMFVGEVVETLLNPDKEPLAYNKGKYWLLDKNIPKPSAEELEKINKIINKFKIKKEILF